MKAQLYNQQAESIGEIDLPDQVFGLGWNSDLVHQAYRVSLAAGRRILSHAKNRAEVSGGGKKPWRQKGTGRARHGSIRSPLWRGGGVTHGPTKERNFKLTIPRKMRKKAIAIALSQKVRRGELMVIDTISLPESKTKHAVQVLNNFVKDKNKKRNASALILIPESSQVLQRAFRNIPRTKMILARNLGLLDLLRYRRAILLKESVPALEKNLTIG